jgi:hypothetical protein
MSSTTIKPTVTPGASDIRLFNARHSMTRAETLESLARIKDVAKASGLTPPDLERLRVAYDANKKRLQEHAERVLRVATPPQISRMKGTYAGTPIGTPRSGAQDAQRILSRGASC